MELNNTTGIITTEQEAMLRDESADLQDQSADAPEASQPVVVPEMAFCTPIQAAKRMGKEPQYIYYLLRNNKVPAEHIKLWPKGDGTLRELLYESFFIWYDNRGSFRTFTAAAAAPKGSKNGPVTIIQQAPVIDMDAIMSMMAARLEASGDKKFKGLAEAIKLANSAVSA